MSVYMKGLGRITQIANAVAMVLALGRGDNMAAIVNVLVVIAVQLFFMEDN